MLPAFNFIFFSLKYNHSIGNAQHTHEEFKPVTILYCILKLFNFCLIEIQAAKGGLIHISWKK